MLLLEVLPKTLPVKFDEAHFIGGASMFSAASFATRYVMKDLTELIVAVKGHFREIRGQKDERHDV